MILQRKRHHFVVTCIFETLIHQWALGFTLTVDLPIQRRLIWLYKKKLKTFHIRIEQNIARRHLHGLNKNNNPFIIIINDTLS